MDFQPPILPTPFLLPPAADASVRLPPLAAQDQPSYTYPYATPFPYQWPGANPCVRLPTQTVTAPPSFPSTSSYMLPQAPWVYKWVAILR